MARRYRVIVLASASPRRADALARIGVRCTVRPVDIDESVEERETAPAYVLRLAREKAAAGARRGAIVLGADTTVALDGRILGKPADAAEGIAMLLDLSGRSHRVFTGIAMRSSDREACRLASAVVTVRPVDRAEATAYWHTGEPSDKAGGYGIQDIGGVFVSRIEGSHGAVVGLPLCETYELLRSFGVDCWETPRRR